MTKIRTNGSHLYNYSQTLALTRPKLKQIAAVTVKRNKLLRRLQKLLNKQSRGSGESFIGNRDPDIEHKIKVCRAYLMKSEFDLVKLNSELQDKQFNRSVGDTSAHSKGSRGKILYSKDGRYDVNDHSGAKPKDRLVTNPVLPVKEYVEQRTEYEKSHDIKDEI